MAKSPLKSTQVLLTPADLEMARRVQHRLSQLQRPTAGPTALYRAGLRTLDEADDETLIRLLDLAEDRPDMEALQERFVIWCGEIARRVAADDPALEYAHDESRGGNPGHFSNQGRFVLLSLMHDGRALIGGLEAVAPALNEGRIPRAQQLFPGGLAVTLSLNSEGEALAARAIIAWLTFHDDELDGVRKAIRAHVATPLR